LFEQWRIARIFHVDEPDAELPGPLQFYASVEFVAG
jgi:hypothetical protein